MADHDERAKRNYDYKAAPKCVVCKQRDRIAIGPERFSKLTERLNAKAKDVFGLTRSDVEKMKTASKRYDQARKGMCCERCVQSLELWTI